MASTGAIRAGRAFVEVGADTNPLTRGLKRSMKELNVFASRVAGIGAKLVGFGAAIVAPLLLAISAGSDLEETMNKFNVVFGKNSAEVKKWGDEYGNQVGRSKRQIADFMASNQDLLVPMGFEPGAATKMSKDITKLSVDLASFNNMQDTDTLRDLQAALTGSGEVMKKYGVIVSQAAVKQEMLNMGINPKTATEAQKAQARFNIILRGTTAAQGDAIRSSNSWANQKKALAATIENVSGAIGNKLLPIVTPLLTKFREGIEIVGNFITENAAMVFAVAGLGAGLIALGGAALAAAIALKVMAVGVGVLSAVLGVVLSPIGLIVGGLAAIIHFSGAGAKALDWLSERFGGLGDFASETFGAIKEALNAGEFRLAGELLWASLKVVWLEGVKKVNDTVDGWKKYIIDKWDDLKGEWTKVVNFFTTEWTKAIDKIKVDWLGFQNEVKPPGELPRAIDEDRPEVSKVVGKELEELRKELKEEADNPVVAKKPVIEPKDPEIQAAIDDRDDILKKIRLLPKAEETKFGQNAAAGGGAANSPAIQKARSLSSGSGDLRSQSGLQALADLVNQGSEDQSLEELKTQTGVLGSIFLKLDKNLPKILETT